MRRFTWLSSLLLAVGMALTVIDFHGSAAPPGSADAGGADVPTASTPPGAGGRQPHAPPRSGEVRQMAIRQLGNFKYEPDKGAGIPADVRRLNGMTVRLTGFMMPMDQSSRITRFSLVPSLFSCCYGQPPGVQHTIVVQCAPDQSVKYQAKPVVVQGKLLVGETEEDGYVVSLFRMSCEALEPAPGER